jgi:putative radical SAM enzyme (TIGR03279 family)
MRFGEGNMTHTITSVAPDSIAEELGIAPGDVLLAINGKAVRDVLDFRFFCCEEILAVEIQKPDGEIWELEIEKDAEEELGLGFATALMDGAKKCANRCVFCFIDQLPPGMRETLYFKDDDPRLSFLTGNYATLTNMSVDEIQRIARYHLSPMRISVHAADFDLRRRMMGKAAPLFEYLRTFNAAGITMHFQIVLCKGLNDGARLDETVKALLSLKPGAASLSVVPAGLTKHRGGLYPLTPFTAEDAAAVIAQAAAWQKKCRKKFGSAFVFCADEWYLLAGLPLPAYSHYEGFPQLENGVGMVALFEREFTDGIKRASAFRRAGIVTGQAAAGFMRRLVKNIPGAAVHEIRNDFFGPGITVSGLLTGKDIIAQLRGKIDAEVLFVPQNAFRANDDVMLDGTTRRELSGALGVTVEIGSADGRLFAKQLQKLKEC